MILPSPLTRYAAIREYELRVQAIQPWIERKTKIAASSMPTYLVDRAGNMFVVDDGLTPEARECIATIDEMIHLILSSPRRPLCIS